MCLQLTFYRMHGYLAATYESVSMRKFLHGRTEVNRSLTFAMKRFITSFDDPTISVTSLFYI
jgi:carnitine O-acetyltransferase